MDGFYPPLDDDEDPVILLWRMENDARRHRNRGSDPDADADRRVGAVVLEFRPRRD